MDKEVLKQKLQKAAWEQTPKVLKSAGITKKNKLYNIRLYEMQYIIYHQLKKCYNLE